MPPRVPRRTHIRRPSVERGLIPTFIEKRRTTAYAAQGCSVNRGGRVMSRMALLSVISEEAQSQKWPVRADTPVPHDTGVCLVRACMLGYVEDKWSLCSWIITTEAGKVKRAGYLSKGRRYLAILPECWAKCSLQSGNPMLPVEPGSARIPQSSMLITDFPTL